ncbi:MAG: NADH-quinone oxidoreductase subunit A [Myxococcales bacterium]
MGFQYATVLVFAVSAAGFCFGNLLIGALLRPRFPSKEKEQTYECGEVPTGEAWFNFNPRFYVIALIFVIFEVEVALMLPVAMIYRSWVTGRHGAVAFFEILTFVLILAVGLVWAWAHGDLEWIKRILPEAQVSGFRPAERPAPSIPVVAAVGQKS